MSVVHRHQHLRRTGQVQSKAKNKRRVRQVDTLVHIFGICSLLFTLDQVRVIWVDHNASGVSVLAWTFYSLSSLVWIYYGRLHGDKAIAFINSLWVLLSVFIVIGAVVY